MTGSVRVPRNLVEVAALIAAGDVAGLADELLELTRRIGSAGGFDGKTVTKLVTTAPADMRAELMRTLVTRADDAAAAAAVDGVWERVGDRVDDVLSMLLRHQVGDLPAEVSRAVVVRAARRSGGQLAGRVVPVARSLLDRGERLPAEAVAALRCLALDHPSPKGELHRLVARLTEPLLNPGEEWADRVLADLVSLPAGWQAVVRHALTATSPRPSATWDRQGRALLAAVEPGSSRSASSPARSGPGTSGRSNTPGGSLKAAAGTSSAPSPVSGMPSAPSPASGMPSTPGAVSGTSGAPRAVSGTSSASGGVSGSSGGARPAGQVLVGWLTAATRRADQPLDPFNAVALRGLCWLTALTPADQESARVLGALVESSLRKIPAVGVRGAKVANAAVHVLARAGNEPALAQLARLATRVTYRPTLKEINAALDTRAAAAGLSRADVEELATPTYGLTDVGRRVVPFGDAAAEVTVGGGRVTVGWRGPTGKPVQAPPAAVRRDFPAGLADLRAEVKDLEKMLTAVSERLDRLFLARRTWPYAAWRERYLDHPLVGTVARRLLWLVGGVPCGFADGALRTLDDTPAGVAPDTPVTIWHPVGRDVDEVLAWREWLQRHLITQPFKQAHRETYPLTVAEERTEVYSNRFAAHVLRQHQFNALAAVRGWRSQLRLMVDEDRPPAMRELPEWGLRAEFWAEGVGDVWAEDTSDTGTYLRVATDQVRFYPLAAPPHTTPAAGGGGVEQAARIGVPDVAPVPLRSVPPLVFSEVMRDIDLFVGVASVGNDPTWQDGGPGGRFREYWTTYSFGELSATAVTRRDLLSKLLPRLSIGSRCTVDGRFLHVRGELRTYKIHLGSGNILMSPNDRYLCIVPNQRPGAGGAASGLFLPFEGDRVLSVILSKAVLLAGDTAITDRSIVEQIRRR